MKLQRLILMAVALYTLGAAGIYAAETLAGSNADEAGTVVCTEETTCDISLCLDDGE